MNLHTDVPNSVVYWLGISAGTLPQLLNYVVIF